MNHSLCTRPSGWLWAAEGQVCSGCASSGQPYCRSTSQLVLWGRRDGWHGRAGRCLLSKWPRPRNYAKTKNAHIYILYALSYNLLKEDRVNVDFSSFDPICHLKHSKIESWFINQLSEDKNIQDQRLKRKLSWCLRSLEVDNEDDFVLWSVGHGITNPWLWGLEDGPISKVLVYMHEDPNLIP